MKFAIALISLIALFSLSLAYNKPCATICPAIYQPVCGEARVGNKVVRCEFSNACMMGVSGC
ncbi:CG42798, partial [Drosophila busckii]